MWRFSSIVRYWILLHLLLFNNIEGRLLRFALVTKGLDNPFFNISREGCQFAASIITNTTHDEVICDYVGPAAGTSSDNTNQQSGVIQANMVQKWINNRTYDGIAIAVSSEDLMTPIINRGIEAGIPIITFDSDASLSKRIAYIGTDNEFFGRQLAKALVQLRPNGGTYGIIATDAPNLLLRAKGIRDTLHGDTSGTWIELPGSPSNYNDDIDVAVTQMIDFVSEYNATAIIGTGADPMRSDHYTSFYDTYARPYDVAVVCGDDLTMQLDYLTRRYVDALVGQLPYDMGVLSLQTLYDLVQGSNVTNDTIGTNILTHIFVPLHLPYLNVDPNLLGYTVYLGYFVFGVTALACLMALMWTWQARKIRVVQVAQPFFLMMIATGVLIMSSLLIPLSFDDGGISNSLNHTKAVAICMSPPWLGCTGFTITFTALFTKTMRINRIFRSGASFMRINITKRDVLPPFLLLLLSNWIVLILWNILDPLTYQRMDHVGTDGWGRVISTYGGCRSNNVWPFLVPLILINVTVLIIANVEAYMARFIQSEFAESSYIGLAMVSMLQAMIMGFPILFVVKANPSAFYVIVNFIMMAVCWTTLGFLFLPKVSLAMKFSKMTPEEQRRTMLSSIQASQRVGGGVLKSGTTTKTSWSGSGGNNDNNNATARSSVVVIRKPIIVSEELGPITISEEPDVTKWESHTNKEDSMNDAMIVIVSEELVVVSTRDPTTQKDSNNNNNNNNSQVITTETNDHHNDNNNNNNDDGDIVRSGVSHDNPERSSSLVSSLALSSSNRRFDDDGGHHHHQRDPPSTEITFENDRHNESELT